MSCFGKKIDRVSCVKYLGVYLDETLSGTEHANSVLKKATARLSFLYRKASLLDQKSRRLLCMALIQPYIDYCSVSWYSGLNARLKVRFDALQRKLIRFVFNLDSRSTIDSSHFSRIGWLCISDRVRYFKILHGYKIFRGMAPDYISGSFSNFSTIHSHNTRGSQTNFIVTKEDTSNSLMLSSFVYTVKREWNSLPSGLKTVTSLSTFKTSLRNYLLKRY